MSSTNINYICKSFENFELKDEFIESLEYEDKLKNLEDENLNEVFMEYVLSSPNIQLSSKVSLILIKIENRLSVDLLKVYISSVTEISDLSNVWKHKHPLLDNDYKNTVGQALIKFGYVKLLKDKDYHRIMLSRKQNNIRLDDYLL